MDSALHRQGEVWNALARDSNGMGCHGFRGPDTCAIAEEVQLEDGWSKTQRTLQDSGVACFARIVESEAQREQVLYFFRRGPASTAVSRHGFS